MHMTRAERYANIAGVVVPFLFLFFGQFARWRMVL